jgi:hypothetical protein
VIDDLIALASRLASASPNKPRQADLRWAFLTSEVLTSHYRVQESTQLYLNRATFTEACRQGLPPNVPS